MEGGGERRKLGGKNEEGGGWWARGELKTKRGAGRGFDGVSEIYSLVPGQPHQIVIAEATGTKTWEGKLELNLPRTPWIFFSIKSILKLIEDLRCRPFLSLFFYLSGFRDVNLFPVLRCLKVHERELWGKILFCAK